jgi:16S rRNA (cytosine967-C5)-methyltransferase
LDALQASDAVAALALWSSVPEWIAERWVARFGAETARAIAEAMLKPARLNLRVNSLKADPAAVLAALASEGIAARPIERIPLALEVEGRPARPSPVVRLRSRTRAVSYSPCSWGRVAVRL